MPSLASTGSRGSGAPTACWASQAWTAALQGLAPEPEDRGAGQAEGPAVGGGVAALQRIEQLAGLLLGPGQELVAVAALGDARVVGPGPRADDGRGPAPCAAGMADEVGDLPTRAARHGGVEVGAAPRGGAHGNGPGWQFEVRAVLHAQHTRRLNGDGRRFDWAPWRAERIARREPLLRRVGSRGCPLSVAGGRGVARGDRGGHPLAALPLQPGRRQQRRLPPGQRPEQPGRCPGGAAHRQPDPEPGADRGRDLLPGSRRRRPERRQRPRRPAAPGAVGALRPRPHHLPRRPGGRAPGGLVRLAASTRERARPWSTTSPHRGEGGAPRRPEVHLAGQVATNVASQEQSAKQGSEIQDASLLFIIVLLFLIFRSVLAPIVTLVPAALVLGLSGSFIGALGSAGTSRSRSSPRSSSSSWSWGPVPTTGCSSSSGCVSSCWEGSEPRDAVVYAVRRVGESITASAATVMVALLTLLAASFGLYHDLGLPLAIGIAVMLLAGLTLLPALLAILGRAVFWPTRTGPRPGRRTGPGAGWPPDWCAGRCGR